MEEVKLDMATRLEKKWCIAQFFLTSTGWFL